MKWLIQWAVTSSALILIVLAVQFLFRKKLSARLKYALWGVVLLRLLFPLQFEALPTQVYDAFPVVASNLARPLEKRLEEENERLSVSYVALIPSELVTWEEIQKGDDVYLTVPLPYDHAPLPEHIQVNEDEVIYQTVRTGDRNMDDRLLRLWQAGAAVTGTAVLLSNLLFSRRLKRRRQELNGVDAPIPVYVAEGLPSPCLFGILRPAVYVTPEAAENPNALRHVLAHELTHYAHRDHIWSLLRCLALALHWYSPLVWLAVVLSKRDGELACDEGAVARLGEGERIPYGRTLVDMVAARSLRPVDLLSCSTAMTGGGKSVKQRVSALVKKPETVKTALFTVVALVALASVFVFAGRGEPVRNLYGPYRYQVSHTQAVQYSPSPLSSQLYPAPITDPDLLEKALEILDSAADLLNTPEELGLDLSEAPFTSPRVTLLENPDGRTSGHTYLLYTVHAVNRDWCLLVTPAEMGAESYHVAGTLDVSAPGGLELLARQQRGRGEKVITPSVTPELEEFFTQLEAAQSIYVGQPMISSAAPPGAITDPDLLALARERLSRFGPPEEGDSLPDPKKLMTASKLTLSDGTAETIYSLVMWNGYTWLIFGDAFQEYASLEEGDLEYGPIFRSADKTNMESTLARYAQLQQERNQDPNSPVPMTREELSHYTPEGIWEARGYRLQGWDGDLNGAEFHYGYASLTRIQLLYMGDEAHEGVWILELLPPGLSSHSSGYTVLADQPVRVYRAEQNQGVSPGYDGMDIVGFAAFLRTEDIASITAGDYEPGQAIGLEELDLPVLKEQLTQSLYHQFIEEYNEEKYGQYVINIAVKHGDAKTYDGSELPEEAWRLTLSVGEEKDAVCLRHKVFAANNDPEYVLVRSPELYRTLRNIFD